MKEYIALHYVHDHKGTLHTPGEIFESAYEAAAEERLLRLHAVALSNEKDQTDDYALPEFNDDAENETLEADETDDVSGMIDVMEGISATKTAKRGKRA